MSFRRSLLELADRVAAGTYTPTSIASAQDVARYRREVQLDLLRETLEYVQASVPYYGTGGEHAAARLPSLTSCDDLRALPVLTKQEIATAPERFISQSCSIVSYQCTSGTTGRRLPVPVAREEAEILSEYDNLRLPASSASRDPTVVLRVIPPTRRLLTMMEGPGRDITLTTTLNLDAASLRFSFDYVDHIILWLTEPIPTPTRTLAAEVLWTVPPFMIRAITEVLALRSFDPRSTAVKAIATSGGVVTSAMADYVNAMWDATLVATYSMTEMIGAHQRCNQTGCYHFGLFPLVEIVEPETKAPSRRGEEGVAVLTSLYPFQQARPLLRYWTGDVFTLQDGDCECGFVGTSGVFRGRLHECVDVSAVLPPDCRPRLVGPADVLEVLHGFPELPQAHKQPKFRLTVVEQDDTPMMLLELEVYPGMEKASRLCDAIADRFARRFQSASGPCLDPDLVRVSLVTKGLLSDSIPYYPDR